MAYLLIKPSKPPYTPCSLPLVRMTYTLFFVLKESTLLKNKLKIQPLKTLQWLYDEANPSTEVVVEPIIPSPDEEQHPSRDEPIMEPFNDKYATN